MVGINELSQRTESIFSCCIYLSMPWFYILQLPHMGKNSKKGFFNHTWKLSSGINKEEPQCLILVTANTLVLLEMADSRRHEFKSTWDTGEDLPESVHNWPPGLTIALYFFLSCLPSFVRSQLLRFLQTHSRQLAASPRPLICFPDINSSILLHYFMTTSGIFRDKFKPVSTRKIVLQNLTSECVTYTE